MTNNEMVDYLINSRYVLKTENIIKAFKSIDRKDFVPNALKDYAYEDRPLPIGPSQTISQPYTVAFMLELLQPRENNLILDVGCGSCYTTALLAFIAKKGRVIGVDIDDNIVEFCKRNLSKYKFDNIEIYKGNKLPPENEYLYDRILVSAAANKLPNELINVLKDSGRMVIPIQSSIYLIKKDKGQLLSEEFFGFAFVELKS